VINAAQNQDAVEVINAAGQGAVVLLCEHASNHIPAPYAGLGLSEADRQSHAAWDPGAMDVSLILSKALDAPLVASKVSRLVYDCNRPPEAASAMPETSEVFTIPGNAGLTEAERAARTRAVYDPFCAAVTDLLDQRAAQGLPSIIVTMHSFTPVYFGQPRAVEIGILHDTDPRLADAMLAQAPRLPHRRIARNEPYGPQDGVTHSLQRHAVSRGLPNVMLELRNDLLASPSAIQTMAAEVLTLLQPALQPLCAPEATPHA
jgi:predicted N-formylglutamate amidohydrolase